MQELIKAAREQLQLVRDLKIANAIEATPEKAQPKRAPFWRSDLTVPRSAPTSRPCWRWSGRTGSRAALPEDKAWIGGWVAFELGQADKVLARVEARGEALGEPASRTPKTHADLTYTLIPLGDVVSLLADDYPGAFGLITGFNSLDGD